MDGSVSILKLSSAMARHAAHQNAVTANNMARADMPGAKANSVAEFVATLRRGRDNGAPEVKETNRDLNIEREMLDMAGARGRHEAALSIWKSTLNMMRLAAAGPRS